MYCDGVFCASDNLFLVKRAYKIGFTNNYITTNQALVECIWGWWQFMLTQDSYVLLCKLTDNSLNDVESFVDFFFLPGVLRFKAFLPIPTHWTPRKCQSTGIRSCKQKNLCAASSVHVAAITAIAANCMYTAILANQPGSEAHTPASNSPHRTSGHRMSPGQRRKFFALKSWHGAQPRTGLLHNHEDDNWPEVDSLH